MNIYRLGLPGAVCVAVAVAVAGAVLLPLGACKGHQPQASPAASASAPVASPAPPVVKKPWYSGEFRGTYQAKRAPVEIKVGAVPEWARDDGKAASGPGKLDLHIADDGTVQGTGEGALGASHVTGRVESDTLRVVLTPDDTTTGLRGVLVANKDGDGFKGSIEASSGNSLTVRSAAIELKKSN